MGDTAEDRKRQLMEFKDLFKALFKIRDHNVQDRVLAAINGIIKDTCDCECCKKEVVHIGTQTEGPQALQVKVENNRSDSMDSGIVINSPVHSDSNSGPEVKRRKRNRKVPRVEKSYSESCPFLAQPKNITNPKESEKFEVSVDSLNWLNDYNDFDLVSEPQEPIKSKSDLVKLMKKEWVASLQRTGGLLPLHKAICDNNYKLLKRQLYVLEKRKQNINELYTDDNESPLQLAIKANSSTQIVEELLNNGAEVSETDSEGNTILHLVFLNTDNTNILKLLLDKTDFDMISKTNYDGLTCLHVGVKHNNFHMCKLLLEYIDEKLGITSVGKNIFDADTLMEIYIKELNSFINKEPSQLNGRKMELLNKTDIKQRWTALFYAVNLESKLMMFMLLCHLADPMISDYSGMDCVNYTDNIENFSSQIKSALRNTASYLEKCYNS